MKHKIQRGHDIPEHTAPLFSEEILKAWRLEYAEKWVWCFPASSILLQCKATADGVELCYAVLVFLAVHQNLCVLLGTMILSGLANSWSRTKRRRWRTTTKRKLFRKVAPRCLLQCPFKLVGLHPAWLCLTILYYVSFERTASYFCGHTNSSLLFAITCKMYSVYCTAKLRSGITFHWPALGMKPPHGDSSPWNLEAELSRLEW